MQREKYTGFELLEPVIEELEQFLNKKYNGLHFRNAAERTYTNLIKEIRD